MKIRPSFILFLVIALLAPGLIHAQPSVKDTIVLHYGAHRIGKRTDAACLASPFRQVARPFDIRYRWKIASPQVYGLFKVPGLLQWILGSAD